MHCNFLRFVGAKLRLLLPGLRTVVDFSVQKNVCTRSPKNVAAGGDLFTRGRSEVVLRPSATLKLQKRHPESPALCRKNASCLVE